MSSPRQLFGTQVCGSIKSALTRRPVSNLPKVIATLRKAAKRSRARFSATARRTWRQPESKFYPGQQYRISRYQSALLEQGPLRQLTKQSGEHRELRFFHKGISDLFSRNVFETLVPGRKMCVVTANVNQHTDHGLLTFPLATDFAILLRNIGFVMVNEIIWSKDGTGGKWGPDGSATAYFWKLSFSS